MKNKKWVRPALAILLRKVSKVEEILQVCKQSQYGGDPQGYAQACQIAQNGCMYCNIPSFS